MPVQIYNDVKYNDQSEETIFSFLKINRVLFEQKYFLFLKKSKLMKSIK